MTLMISVLENIKNKIVDFFNKLYWVVPFVAIVPICSGNNFVKFIFFFIFIVIYTVNYKKFKGK